MIAYFKEQTKEQCMLRYRLWKPVFCVLSRPRYTKIHTSDDNTTEENPYSSLRDISKRKSSSENPYCSLRDISKRKSS